MFFLIRCRIPLHGASRNKAGVIVIVAAGLWCWFVSSITLSTLKAPRIFSYWTTTVGISYFVIQPLYSIWEITIRNIMKNIIGTKPGTIFVSNPLTYLHYFNCHNICKYFLQCRTIFHWFSKEYFVNYIDLQEIIYALNWHNSWL